MLTSHTLVSGTVNITNQELATEVLWYLELAACDVTGLLAQPRVADGVLVRGDVQVFGEDAAQDEVAEEALDVGARPVGAERVHGERVVLLLHDLRVARTCNQQETYHTFIHYLAIRRQTFEDVDVVDERELRPTATSL